MLALSVTIRVEPSCPFTPGAKRTPIRQCAPRATLAPLMQVVLAGSTRKLASLKLTLPITSADLLRKRLPITTILTALTVPTLCGVYMIVLGV